tara:strand:+ start:1186 stop:1794 length:609 start_codon:yes stop_codon:yes gene_type:complete
MPGQGVNSRASSTRNGFNVSASNYNSINNSMNLPPKLVEKRNNILGVKHGTCYYCKENRNTTDDHLIPTCNTKYSIYGQNNILNIFPCCGNCNGSKSAKVNIQLKEWLKTRNDYWSEDKINVLFGWIEENKEYLYMNEEWIEYLNEQHKTINSAHNVMNICSKNKEDIDYLLGKTMFEKLIGYEISDDKFNDIISSQKRERL